MDTIAKVLALLEKKSEFFDEYEKATQELLRCDADDVEYYITRRAELANEIDQVTEEIGLACDGQPSGEIMFAAASSRVDYQNVPPELRPVFESGQNIRSTASRIMQTEMQAISRLESLRDEAKEKIRQNQNLPKIKKYLTDLAETPAETSFTEGKA